MPQRVQGFPLGHLEREWHLGPPATIRIGPVGTPGNALCLHGPWAPRPNGRGERPTSARRTLYGLARQAARALRSRMSAVAVRVAQNVTREPAPPVHLTPCGRAYRERGHTPCEGRDAPAASLLSADRNFTHPLLFLSAKSARRERLRSQFSCPSDIRRITCHSGFKGPRSLMVAGPVRLRRPQQRIAQRPTTVSGPKRSVSPHGRPAPASATAHRELAAPCDGPRRACGSPGRQRARS